MKKTIVSVLITISLALIVVFTAVGCAKEEAASPPAPAAPVEGAYADGIYFAMADSFDSSGWKETVTITVQGGNIVDVNWNGVHINGGADKKTYDKAGKYRMKQFGGAQAEWYEQAQKAEAYLVQTQDPTKITYSDAEGHTDAIAGVSIHVSTLFDLAKKALESGPVGRGPYEDGAYFVIDDEFGSSGWKEYVSISVLNGRIAAVNWSAVNKQGDDKKAYDKAGKYGMKQFGGAQAEWYEQAQKAEAYLVQTQDPTKITYSDAEGHTDAIAGVSIHVSTLFDLAKKALESGPVPLGPYADGGYYASEEDFGSSGWKGFVSLLVNNGNIVHVYWSAVNEAGEDKKDYDMAGKYQMVARGGAIDEWYVQAQRVEEYLLATQDPAAITYSDEEGHTDAISQATIHVKDFFTLVEKALAAGPKKY